ncbi:peptidylprolyl isomerase [Nocardioides sp. CFH 31398]|uniref:peptidylprolyl isomerase n=1 Tax=Nocardioides sp. CFH 31398 TaxID=2919579 RepID=UPI001F061466|nr:peptidylprolyl isomerase [Nocardioides sp. CFH 31398]MCH1866965.1 peptidylprolyl isomerase [Nocardioides sp. CFH 31398]
MRSLSVASCLVLLSLGLSACGSDDGGTTASEGGETVECDYPADGRPPAREVDPPPTEAQASGEVAATITLGGGDVPITLDAADAPCTVNSFTSLAEQGYFDDTPCHRLTTDGIFVLQCGDPTEDPMLRGTGGPGYSFGDETSPDDTYGRGTLAMANSGPDTNGSQFFMVYDDSPLPPDYTVFGSISEEGLEVIDAIAEEGAQGGAPDGAPAAEDDATIESVTLD